MCCCQPLQVSAFIVLAKEQAEQEQLARSQQRQHYSFSQQTSLPHSGGYMLQQQAYLPQQQQMYLPQQQQAYLPQQVQQVSYLQQPQQYHHHVDSAQQQAPQQQQQQPSLVVMAPAAMGQAGLTSGWPSAMGQGAAQLDNATYSFAQQGVTVATIPPGPQALAHAMNAQQQQQHQQVWAAVTPSNLPNTMLQQQQQAQMPQMIAMPAGGSGYGAAQDPNTPAQYAGSYMINTAGQTMHAAVLAQPAPPGAGAGGHVAAATGLPSSAAMLLSAQQQQQLLASAGGVSSALGLQGQQQHHHHQLVMPSGSQPLLGMTPAVGSCGAIGLQQQATISGSATLACPTLGLSSSATTSNNNPEPFVLGGQQHHQEGQAAAAEHATALQCGVGGTAFVQDMLQSLNYTAAGQQQQQCVVTSQPGTWVSAAAAPTAAVSWAMVQQPSTGGAGVQTVQGLTVGAGVLDSSPSFSATSSTSANTSTGFALPRMCAATSPACA